MKSEYLEVLNKLFAETYNNIGKYEETVLSCSSKHNLSLNEFHIVECIGSGDEKGRTIGDIAQHMNVTLPTITVAVNKLEKKGYVTKARCEKDGRVVYITLTRMGMKMNAAHRYFHKHMVRTVGDKFNDEEMEILIRCMSTLNEIFIKEKDNEL